MFWGINGAMLFPRAKVECHTFKYALLPFNRRVAKKGELDTELELIELDDVEKATGQILSSSRVTELQSAKLLFGTADVLTTRLRPNLGKTILNDQSRVLGGTTEWIPLKLNYERLHPLVAKWYLLSSRYVNNAGRLLSGKEHPRVDESDIFALRIPFPSKAVQQSLVKKISAIETEISKARIGLRDQQSVIDEVICSEFRYPLREHLEREREKEFIAPFHAMTAAFTLRSSAKFHHPSFDLITQFFAHTPYERVKRFLSVPIRLGATAKKGDFVEDGAAYYVHPGATKRQAVIAIEDCYQVPEEFYAATQRRFGLRREDVIINRSGEALGKVAFWDSDEPAVASDFTMRVRFDKARMNPRFSWYFFRSVIFQAQIQRELRGSSVPNIFPPEVEQMIVVSCEKARQDEIADSISAELQRRDGTLQSIVSGQAKIAALIDEAIQA